LMRSGSDLHKAYSREDSKLSRKQRGPSTEAIFSFNDSVIIAACGKDRLISGYYDSSSIP
jgi:hypothetical protein